MEEAAHLGSELGAPKEHFRGARKPGCCSPSNFRCIELWNPRDSEMARPRRLIYYESSSLCLHFLVKMHHSKLHIALEEGVESASSDGLDTFSSSCASRAISAWQRFA